MGGTWRRALERPARRMAPNRQAKAPALQDRLIATCAEISGVALAG